MSNIVTRADVLARANQIGSQEGAAGNLRHELAIVLADAANQQAINPSTKSEDVRDFYRSYLEGKTGAAYSPDAGSENSFDANVSKWRTIATCGQHRSTEGVEVLERTRDIAKALRAAGTSKSSIFDAMVTVARTQNKTPDAVLTDDEIKGLLVPADKDEAEYTEKSALDAQLKSLCKLRDGTEGNDSKPGKPGFPSPQLDAAIKQIENRLAELAPKEEAAIAALIAAGQTRDKALKVIKGLKLAA